MPSPSRPRVLVIGAGLSGLAAATRLAARGCEPIVVERGSRPGGHAGGTWLDGFAIERTPGVLFGSDRRLLGWIAALGLADELLPLRRVELAQVHRGVPVAIEPQTLYGVSRLRGLRLHDALRTLRLRRLMRRYAPFLDPERPERAADLDWRSVADFAQLYFGRRLAERLIGPEASQFSRGDERELSRVVFLLQWLSSQGTGVGIPRGALHEIAERAAQRCAVRFHAHVERLQPGPSGGFVAAIREPAGERSVDADAVILATGPREAERLAARHLTLPERDFFAAQNPAPAICWCVGLHSPPVGIPQWLRVPHAEGSPIEAILVEPGIAGGRAPEGCGRIVAATTERFAEEHARVDDGVIEKALLGELDRLFPHAARRVRFSQLTRERDGLPRFHVGAYRALARFVRVQGDRRAAGRRLYFAGDYLSGPRAEHATASGIRAADEVVHDAVKASA